MKRHLPALILLFLIITASSCKKNDGFDPMTKSVDDFIGTWHGTITTFKNNKLIKETGDVMFYHESADVVAGIIFINETLYLKQFQFQNGTLYFKITNNDPQNPTCQLWNLGGYTRFSEDGIIDFRISGNECGAYGSEYVDWSGSLGKKQVSPDSLKYFHFAALGRLWGYRVTYKNGDTCNLNKLLSDSSAFWYYKGLTLQSCGWTPDTLTLKWAVTPADFTTTSDSTLSQFQILFPLWAKQGVTYRTINENDTTTVTLVDTSIVMTTPAGAFNCMHYQYTEPAYSGEMRYTKISHLWINRTYGIIRHEIENPSDSTGIKNQVLTSKSY